MLLLLLQVPADCFELLYRLGQKTEIYDRVKVEYFAPYLMKEGTVQRVQIFPEGGGGAAEQDGSATTAPTAIHVIERFRHRKDRMVAREAFPENSRLEYKRHWYS